jgi:uncharacterized protein RhaS with RHS repeats
MDLKRRFYDPSIGQFMQVDPVTASQENYSTYQYGWNNPILRSDPNGDCPICDDFRKLYNSAKNYLAKNASVYAKGSAEVTAGLRVSAEIGKNMGGDMNAASVRLIKKEVSGDSKDGKKSAPVDYISKPNSKGEKTMTVSHGVEYASGVGGAGKMEYQLNSSGKASGEGASEVQVTGMIIPGVLSVFGKYEKEKSSDQSSVQIGLTTGYKGGAGVVIDANAEVGFKFRIPNQEKP